MPPVEDDCFRPSAQGRHLEPLVSTLLRINEYSSMQWADTRQSTLTAYTDGNIEHTYVVVTLNIGHINIKINLEKNMMQAFGT